MLGSGIDFGNPVTSDHPLNRGLVSWWLPLPNNQGGSRLFDLVGGNHGTLTNGPTWASGPSTQQSIQFDGTDDYVEGTTVTGLASSSQATLATWFYRTTTATVGCGGVADNRFHFVWASDNYIYFSVENGTNVYPRSARSETGWHHVAMVYDGSLAAGSRIAAYFDGVPISVSYDLGSVTPPSTISASVGNFLVGKDSNGGTPRYWAGRVTDTRIYPTRALSASEVWQLYLESRTGYPNLLRRSGWRFYAFPTPAASSFSPYWIQRSRILGGGL